MKGLRRLQQGDKKRARGEVGGQRQGAAEEWEVGLPARPVG